MHHKFAPTLFPFSNFLPAQPFIKVLGYVYNLIGKSDSQTFEYGKNNKCFAKQIKQIQDINFPNRLNENNQIKNKRNN